MCLYCLNKQFESPVWYIWNLPLPSTDTYFPRVLDDARGSETFWIFPLGHERTRVPSTPLRRRRPGRSSIVIDRRKGETIIRKRRSRSVRGSWSPSTCVSLLSFPRIYGLRRSRAPPPPRRRYHARGGQPITSCTRYLRATLTLFSRGMRSSRGKRENSPWDRPRASFLAAFSLPPYWSEKSCKSCLRSWK